MTFSATPPPVCLCGHTPADHDDDDGRCQADTYRAEVGRSFICFCPLLVLDGDR